MQMDRDAAVETGQYLKKDPVNVAMNFADMSRINEKNIVLTKRFEVA
jgi:hypothetical protein